MPDRQQPIRHLVSVWNPSYAADAMDAHLDVLLSWAERQGQGGVKAEDVYVWWAKVRSPNRQQPLPHRTDILVLDEQCQVGIETHLYLTDYRSLYVGQLGEITDDDVPGDTPAERDHMPDYYRELSVDLWLRLFDIRRLVANDTVAVIGELRKVRNTRYHSLPVSLYGGMVDMPLIVTRDDDSLWFSDRDQLTDGTLWAVRDARLRGETERVAAELRDNVLGHAVWTVLEAATRTFLATGEALLRAHRDDPRFDFSGPSVEYAKAVETELNALIFPALRGVLSKKPPHERETRIDDRRIDLGARVGHMSLGTLHHLLKHDTIVQKALPAAVPQDHRWILGELPSMLEVLVKSRNPAAHSEVLARDPAVQLRDSVLGIGVEGLIARIARGKMRLTLQR